MFEIRKIQAVWPPSSIFLHFSPPLSLLLDYSLCLASAPHIQTGCDLYCWMPNLRRLYWKHIYLWVQNTEAVKLPCLPELVSSKGSKEKSKMCSFLLRHSYYCIILLFLGDQKNKIWWLLDANSPGRSAIIFLNGSSHTVYEKILIFKSYCQQSVHTLLRTQWSPLKTLLNLCYFLLIVIFNAFI